jgi:hypothetical protein
MKATPTDSAIDAGDRELRLDRLLGRPVLTRNNQSVGRLEEFRAETHGRDWAIMEYVIGAAGLMERLGVGFNLLFGKAGAGYVARWDQLDISDPERPRLTCGVEELRRL